jgi:hypothetical protein
MYLFRIFRSFLPMSNPLGFGASDWVVLALAILLIVLLVLTKLAMPYAREIGKRTVLCMGLLFGLAVSLRVALLPQSPLPIPSGADDFSYILLGDTLRHLRMANAAHPLHQFFEAVFILQEPTYASIYPLGQGIVLALGQVVFGSYWAGVLISDGVFCALCYWMLRGWVAPIWALAGGLLAVMEFGPLNPWVNSYWGGAVSAGAGCLVFGSLPRLRVSPRIRYGASLGTGVGLQILARPFEALFLGVAVFVYFAFALRMNLRAFARPVFSASGVIVAALGLTLLQNKAVTHSWTTMPYMLSRYQYGVPATLTFQPNALPHRPMTAEQKLDYEAQKAVHGAETDSVAAYFRRLIDRFRFLRFFLLPPLYFAIAWFVPSLRQRRYLWAAGTIVLFVLGTNFYGYFYPQYIAALTCLFVLFSVVGLERLSGAARLSVWLLCGAWFVFWFGLYASGDSDLLSIARYQSWYYVNRGDPQGREAIENQLMRNPGKQLVFVRYAPSHRFEEWIHNAADIDSSRIVWANDLGPEENAELLRYYASRKAWLLEPDAHPPALTPYAVESSPFMTVH